MSLARRGADGGDGERSGAALGAPVARPFDLVHVGLEVLGEADEVRLVAHRAQHVGADVPRGVGGEADGAGGVEEADRAEEPLRPLLEEVGLLDHRRVAPVGHDLVHLVVDEPLVVQEQLVVRRAAPALAQPEVGVAHRQRRQQRRQRRRRAARRLVAVVHRRDDVDVVGRRPPDRRVRLEVAARVGGGGEEPRRAHERELLVARQQRQPLELLARRREPAEDVRRAHEVLARQEGVDRDRRRLDGHPLGGAPRERGRRGARRGRRRRLRRRRCGAARLVLGNCGGGGGSVARERLRAELRDHRDVRR